MFNLNIRTKVVALVSGISIVAYIGFAVFMYNAATTRQMYRTLTRDYIQSVVQDDVANFTGFLNSIEFASVGSPTIGELYYKLRKELSKEEMTTQLAESYKLFFSRSSSLLGGGAFYEPNAFYADQKDFHMFASKPSANTTNPKNINAEATWDVDTYGESWYQIALPSNWNRNQKRDKALYWSELYVDSSINVLMTSVCAPMYDENNKIIGVGTVDVSLETLQNMIQAFKKPTENSNIVGFSTLNKATFATADKEANNIKAYPSGSWLQELSKLAPNDKLINHDLKIKDQSYTLYASVHQSGMGFAMLIPNEELFNTIETVQNNNLVVAVVICILMLLTTIIGVVLIRKWLIAPLGHLTVYASEIETGNLNAELKGNFTQEMGLLSRTITNMVQFLKKEMHNAAEKSKQANKLAEDADQAKKEVEKSLNVETLRRQQIVVATQELSKVASQLSTVSHNISSGTQEIKKGSQQQHEQLQDVVQYMNEMRSSVGAVASSASQAAEAAKQSKTEALNGEHIVKNSALALQDISEQAATLMEKMKILGDKSNSIGSIMTMIEDIADQTNLLALNAAIEAARAGEAGRGFAVVADEVRKLAEKTMSATSEVAQAVKAIQLLTEENSMSMQKTLGSITKASEMANESNQGLKTIVNIAQTTAEEVNNIANASEKQSASVQTIGESVEQVFNIANRTTEQVENTVLALKDLMSQTEQLQQVMASLKEDTK